MAQLGGNRNEKVPPRRAGLRSESKGVVPLGGAEPFRPAAATGFTLYLIRRHPARRESDWTETGRPLRSGIRGCQNDRTDLLFERFRSMFVFRRNTNIEYRDSKAGLVGPCLPRCGVALLLIKGEMGKMKRTWEICLVLNTIWCAIGNGEADEKPRIIDMHLRLEDRP